MISKKEFYLDMVKSAIQNPEENLAEKVEEYANSNSNLEEYKKALEVEVSELPRFCKLTWLKCDGIYYTEESLSYQQQGRTKNF